MEIQKIPNSENNPERKMELEESTFLTSDYTTNLQSFRQRWYWHKNRNTDQWNKIKRPEINSYTCGHLTFDKRGKNTQ